MNWPTLDKAANKLLEAGYQADEVQSASFNVKSQLESVIQMTQAVRSCNDCALQGECNIPAVPGMGSWNASLMIVGDGPGEDDAKIGAPFIGASGQLLTLILNKLGVNRHDVYLTNAIKCTTGRTLTFEEALACSHHLFNEIAQVKPMIILSMGNRSLRVLSSDPEAMVSKYRGRIFNEQSAYAIPVMPTYNPGYLFHNEGAKLLQYKKEVFADIKAACVQAGLIQEAVSI